MLQKFSWSLAPKQTILFTFLSHYRWISKLLTECHLFPPSVVSSSRWNKFPGQTKPFSVKSFKHCLHSCQSRSRSSAYSFAKNLINQRVADSNLPQGMQRKTTFIGQCDDCQTRTTSTTSCCQNNDSCCTPPFIYRKQGFPSSHPSSILWDRKQTQPVDQRDSQASYRLLIS